MRGLWPADKSEGMRLTGCVATTHLMKLRWVERKIPVRTVHLDVVRDFCRAVFVYHPSYSPALSSPDYFLFSKSKMKWKDLHFGHVAEIKEAVTDELKKAQKEEFSAAFQKLYDRTKS
jgi:hypothetical protein